MKQETCIKENLNPFDYGFTIEDVETLLILRGY